MNNLAPYYKLSRHAAAAIRHLPKDLGDLLSEKIALLAKDPTNASLGSYLLEDLKVKDKHAFELTDGYRVVYDLVSEIRIWYVVPHDVADHHYRSLSFSVVPRFERIPLGLEPRETSPSGKPVRLVPDQNYPYVALTPAHLRILGVSSALVSTVRFCPSFSNLRNVPGVPEDVAQHVNELALRSRTDEDDLFSEDDLAYRDTTSRVEDFCRGNIRQLMVNLNAEQDELARRELSSSILVRGCAGSGKTSVALQRAANLYLNDKKVLYVTYTTVLADFADSLLGALAGGSLPEDRIAIETTSQLARSILTKRGLWKWDAGSVLDDRSYIPLKYMTWACSDMSSTDASSVLKQPSFVLDEVREVIKGMSVISEEQYLSVQRHGRGRPLSEDARRAVWKAYTKYQDILRRHKAVEWADVPMLTLRELQERPYEHLPYDEVIIDEAQDLSVTDIRLCTMLAPVLFVVGDVAQSIYARGYSWRDAGLELRGHSYSLKHDYRNTREIAEAGRSLLAAESELATSDDLVPMESARRHGPWPIILRAQTRESEVDAVCAKIGALTANGELNPGDCAILCRTRALCKTAAAQLSQHGIRAWVRQQASYPSRQMPSSAALRQGLDVFDNTAKVLTYQSAKGLEFPVVFVLGCDDGDLPYVLPASDPEADAELRRQRRVLYVSMTRAIEAVYLVTCQDRPSRFLSELSADKTTLELYTSQG
jgi:superfamily I DNA/RNA helicase